MCQLKKPEWFLALTAILAIAPVLEAADHGPVFGLATPTNPKGGWSFDLGLNGRSGTASTLEAELTYGLTQNLKLAVSAPVVFQADPYPRSSVTTNTPISGDFSGLAWWRFQRKDFAGKRVESTAVGGVLVPGPQQETGPYRDLNSGAGLSRRRRYWRRIAESVRLGGRELPTLCRIERRPPS